MPQPSINSRKSAAALVFWQPIRFLWPATLWILCIVHAPVPVFPAHPARDAKRGRDCLASADAARRHDAARSRRHLCLPAAWVPCAAENLPDRARGTEPLRRDRAVDADDPVGRSLARERAL